MDFSYKDYKALIYALNQTGYVICDYDSWCNFDRCVILRHDVDINLDTALDFARIEENLGVKSTYFILLTSDFYNLFSAKSRAILQSVLNCGHEIGLHFDETQYPETIGKPDMVTSKITEEAAALSTILQLPVTKVSMHRPSKEILKADMKIPGMINSYGKTFFNEFKYLSDSRRRWREPVMDIVNSGEYDRLHILTHPFWYLEASKGLHERLKEFVSNGNPERWDILDNNFTELPKELAKDEIL